MEATNLMATNRQLFALWLASGKSHDYRNDNLTKEQASKLLEEFNEKSGYKKAAKEKKPTTRAKKESPKVNKFGVKVGTIFHSSWGYDQTNNTFLQVIALCGESSVRVREVSLERETEKAIGFMSANYVYKIPQDGELSAYPKRSVFIKDQENGDLKRLRGEAGEAVFTLDSFCDAYQCKGEKISCYESWYA